MQTTGRTKFRGDGAKRAPNTRRIPKNHPWRLASNTSYQAREARIKRMESELEDKWHPDEIV
jgi:hypothetical protein